MDRPYARIFHRSSLPRRILETKRRKIGTNIRVGACATLHPTRNTKDKKNQQKKNCQTTFDFWFALLLVGPEEKPLENFSSWETRSNIPRAPGGRPLFNPRSFISVIAVLNNCISPPITSSLSRLVCAKYLKSASNPIPYPHSTSANSMFFIMYRRVVTRDF